MVSNPSLDKNERSHLLSNKTSDDDHHHPYYSSQPDAHYQTKNNALTLLFQQPSSDNDDRCDDDDHSPKKKVPIVPLLENSNRGSPKGSVFSANNKCTTTTDYDVITSTMVGSTVFLLYQVVFCLAQAATITRPHNATHSSNTGVMAQTAALGILTAGPLFLWELGDQIPAIYPASDLFLAPFLASLSRTIDQVLFERGLQDDDAVFLATFGMVLAVGFLLSGCLCILAARIKLANLGAFLPYSVLCGFFTTIGILMWTLGFSVDVGHKVGQVVLGGDVQLMKHALLHHLPSLGVGIIMHILGPKNPLYVIMLVGCTVAGSYVVMWITGTTLAEAQAQQWFFSASDLIPRHPTLSWQSYAVPAPFGVWVSAWRGHVHWEAFLAGMPMMLALVLLYLVRCSLHAAALKKNIPMVTRKKEDDDTRISIRRSTNSTSSKFTSSKTTKEPLTLNFILEHGYGYTQLLNGLVGGIAIAPSVAASLTLFKLRAETPPPQYGSCILVIIFYFSNFTLVQYIPKPAFSSLMVLAGLDMIRTWIIDSFLKTKHKVEWAVAPALVILSFTIGVLNAIFAGVAISTFVFAANFYHAGAVKFVGSGLTLRSAVERGICESDWLDTHGDWIQILVVQNYLFFGNCQSLLTYISTMFEDIDESSVFVTAVGPFSLPPKPKYLVIDFGLVSGMDTSAIDILKEIVKLAKDNRCKLFLSGLQPFLKSNLIYAGLRHQSNSCSYTADMETALARAEDALLSTEFHLEEKNEVESSNRLLRRTSSSIRRRGEAGIAEASSLPEDDDGFVYALQKIDEQHGLSTAKDLAPLSAWTNQILLEPGEVLQRDSDHGLYFVETGLLRVQWSAAGSTMRNFANLTWNGLAMAEHNEGARQESGSSSGENNLRVVQPTTEVVTDAKYNSSIGHLNARSEAISRETALWKQHHHQHAHTEQTFRLARIGQGWVIGGIEAANGMKKPGVYLAISSCRLYHLPRSAIQRLEVEEPSLAMHLYRMISHLATKKQELTITHLGQQLRILNSPVPRLRGRGKLGLMSLLSTNNSNHQPQHQSDDISSANHVV